jgi:hypothetical protein
MRLLCVPHMRLHNLTLRTNSQALLAILLKLLQQDAQSMQQSGSSTVLGAFVRSQPATTAVPFMGWLADLEAAASGEWHSTHHVAVHDLLVHAGAQIETPPPTTAFHLLVCVRVYLSPLLCTDFGAAWCLRSPQGDAGVPV